MTTPYPIVMVEHDPAWPAAFEREAARLRTLVPGNTFRRIEHIGSTAVPGLAAKPVIDMLIEIESFDAARTLIVPCLEADGYGCTWRTDPDAPPLSFFGGYGPDGYLDGVQRYHLHMLPAEHSGWKRVLFRNYLREHPDEATRYAALKWRLASEFRDDRDAYTDAKTALITEMTDRAIAASS